MAKSEIYKQRRRELIAISKEVKPLVTAGAFDSVNEAIIELMYKEDGEVCEFETFHGWIDRKMKVKKGEKAYVVWGRPRKVEQTDDKDEEKEYSFYPLAYIFKSTQVEPMKERVTV